MSLDSDEALAALAEIADPEIPIVNIVELGIVRRVSCTGETATVDITPTYSGCPAMKMIEDQIQLCLRQQGFSKVTINTVYAPAWTTEWLSEETKQKLKSFGIAPALAVSSDQLVSLPRKEKIACPRCGSIETELRSEFGSTACKSICFCKACQEPFEYFKEI